MEQVFSIGHDIWSFFQAIFNPAEYPEWIQQGWPIGLGLLAMLALVSFLRSKQGRMQRREQLEALEEALLDEDLEDRSLELPDSPLDGDLYEEYGEDESPLDAVGDEPVPEPLHRTLTRDPEFGGQIVIDANSTRKSATEDEPAGDSEEIQAPPDGSLEDIDHEFAQFAQELKDKAKEVQRRHQIEDDLMESELFEEDFQPKESVGPLSLSVADMLPEDEDSLDGKWNQELEDILEKPVDVYSEDEALHDDLRNGQGSHLDRDPLEIQERNEQLIQRLEEFQKDFEHKIQSRTLSKLAQQNFELVESLSDSTQTRYYQEMKRNQMESLSSLESMVFGSDKKKR